MQKRMMGLHLGIAVFLIGALALFPATALGQQGGVVVFSKLIEGPVPADDPMSSTWDQARPVEFPLSAQVHWEPRLLWNPTATSVKVSALHNEEDLAILLEYKDPKKGPNDAAAIEFPVGDEKAHFAHAQPMVQVEGGYVNIWYWKGDEAREMNAQGFGTLKPQAQQDVDGLGVWQDGVWRVVFSRKLETGDEKDARIVPGEFHQIAFAIWDGENGETGSKKAVSSWWYFRAEPPPDPTVWIYSLIAVAGAVIFEMVLLRRLRKRPENA